MEDHGCLWPSDVRSQVIYSQGCAQVCLGIIRVQYEGFTFVSFLFNRVFFILTTKVLRQDMFVRNMLRRSEMTQNRYIFTFARTILFVQNYFLKQQWLIKNCTLERRFVNIFGYQCWIKNMMYDSQTYHCIWAINPLTHGRRECSDNLQIYVKDR